jgi:curved DNA-binding protein CbpA
MELEQCYRELGVRSDADLSEVKFAFRQLSLVYHPDRNTSPEAGTKFRTISEAYSTIMRLQSENFLKHADNPIGVDDELFVRKLTFAIMTDKDFKEVVYSVSADLFEHEIHKYFNPRLAPGTCCKIGRRWFEIGDKAETRMRILHLRSGGRDVLIEWYKAPNGTDRSKQIGWDDFSSYAHQYASSVDSGGKPIKNVSPATTHPR